MNVKRLTIAVENSTWNNIGDAFYQCSIEAMLREHLPECRIISLDGPFQRSFRPGRHEARGLDSRFSCDADHYVFSGPILGAKFLSHYAALIKDILARGKTYSLLSIHDGCSTPEQRAEIRAFLGAYPPIAVHSRDNPSYGTVGDLARASLQGICFAFFVSRIPNIPNLDLSEAYLCASFYSMPEPDFHYSGGAEVTSIQVENIRKSRHWRFLRHLEHRRKRPAKIGPWQIYRPVHGFYPMPHLTFTLGNNFITYNPYVFLSVYKSCNAVLSDRVHAGVAGLSFGKPAYVIPDDRRFALFETAGFTQGEGLFFTPDDRRIKEQYDRHADWVKQDFRAALFQA